MNITQSNSNSYSNTKLQIPKTQTRTFCPKFGAIEQTLVKLNPDSFERNLTNSIMGYFHLRGAGLKVVKSGIDESSKVKGIVIEGENAVSRAKDLTQRFISLFSNKGDDLLHSSDSTEVAQREIGEFFRDLPPEKCSQEQIQLDFAE